MTYINKPLYATNPRAYNLYIPCITIPTTKQVIHVPANTRIGSEKELNGGIGLINTPKAIRNANSPNIPVKDILLNRYCNIFFNTPLFISFIQVKYRYASLKLE